MRRRTVLKVGAAAGIAVAVPFGPLAKPPKALAFGLRKNPVQRKITAKDRKAAAGRAAKARQAAGVTSIVAPALAPLATPDYFGTFPNYANSPLPLSVSIWGDGVGATATATVSGGTISAITVVTPGTGYTAAQVLIIGGGGGGAVATATIAAGAITAITVTSPGSGYNTKPGTRKFMDSLPGLTAAGANNLGQYIPVAVADQTSFLNPSSPTGHDDYYEIAVVQYTEKLHTDLNPTTLRGYVQLGAGLVAGTIPLFYPDGITPIMVNGVQAKAVDKPSYLGPVIVAQRDAPVRITFRNLLPTGAGGDLFIPVDDTVMGAGMGPDGTTSYTQNRATLHLHGGNTPWISDGTAHQWTTPAGESTVYPKGVSVYNVPDMPNPGAPFALPDVDPGAGTLTFYYTNQQSARLMFYHDHSYGITRLNVYAGEAAGYLVTDPIEAKLVSGGTIGATVVAAGTVPSTQIPLIIQDKTFIPSTGDQLNLEDPTWPFTVDGTKSDLWWPHVYMPNQNPGDPSGANAMGRWDYGPWFWPPFTGITNGPVPNPLFGQPGENAVNPGTPNPTIVPEGFMDTPLVNGTAYPYVNVPHGLVRFRVLNACNDRYLNLSLWVADPLVSVATGAPNPITEVTMVPFNSSQNVATPFPAWWYTVGTQFTFDDRFGGVPDPTTRGPAMIQIGTEGGFLPAPAVIRNQPVNYTYNRRDIVVLSVQEKGLFLGPAERADILVDFTNFSGKTLILYSDAPAPMPANDPRLDYFTGDPDLTDSGGTPSTLPGFGPNIRTIMQINVAGGGSATAPVDDYSPAVLTALQTALPAAFKASQDAPIVPQAPYNAAYGASFSTNNFARIQDNNMTFFNGLTGLQGIALVSSIPGPGSGSGYVATPFVYIAAPPPGGTQATAQATLTPTSVASLALTAPGLGYTAAPAVTITGGGGTGATATATILLGGAGYLTAPTVTITAPPPGGTQATATATVSLGRVTSVKVTKAGSGYTSAPLIGFVGVGSGATAVAPVSGGKVTGITLTGPVVALTRTAGGSGYTSAPTLTIATPTTLGGIQATGTATLTPTSVGSISLLNPGTGYTSAPLVTITANGPGSGATAIAVGATLPLLPKAIQELFDPDYGRMNAILGVEIPNTTGVNQTTIPYYFIDPPTEIVNDVFSNSGGLLRTLPLGSANDSTQIWKITHNGVDTHAIHFHLFNVQVINRVGWDGAIRPPDANEIGWKETVRMNPLEDIIVAARPSLQNLPWDLPNSWRRMNPAMPNGATTDFTNVDPSGQPAAVTNAEINFGYEYVWHCHLLGHEENDMMRGMIFAVAPKAPTLVSAVAGKGSVKLTWTDNSVNETGFTIQRAASAAGPWTTVGTVPVSRAIGASTGNTLTFTNTGLTKGTSYSYRVIANNVVGDTFSYAAPVQGYPYPSADSAPSLVKSAVSG